MIKNKIFDEPTFDFSDLVFLYDCNYHNRNVASHDFDEGAALYKYAKRTEGNILEIGRRWGGSTACLVYGMYPNTTGRILVSVDNKLRNKEFPQKIFDTPGMKDNLELITHDSKTFITDKRFDLAFIDGYHKYVGVYNDTLNCWPTLNMGCIVIYHDANICVRPAVKWKNTKKSGSTDIEKLCNLLLRDKLVEEYDSVGTMRIFKKIKELGPKWKRTA